MDVLRAGGFSGSLDVLHERLREKFIALFA
jgi:hypothetical protein